MALSTEDKLAILDLASRVNNAASHRDVEEYIKYFALDGALEGDMGTLVGQDALRKGLGPIWEREGRAMLHLVLNPLVDETEEGARLSYTLLIMHADAPQTIVGTAQVDEQVQKVQGYWRVIHHRVTLPVQSHD